MHSPRPVATEDAPFVPAPRPTLSEVASPSFTRSQEDELLARYAETGSPALKVAIAEAFLPLARALMYRYRVGFALEQGRSASIDDLTRVAHTGLLNAIEGFDQALEEPFRSYATPIILNELRRHCRDHVWT